MKLLNGMIRHIVCMALCITIAQVNVISEEMETAGILPGESVETVEVMDDTNEAEEEIRTLDELSEETFDKSGVDEKTDDQRGCLVINGTEYEDLADAYSFENNSDVGYANYVGGSECKPLASADELVEINVAGSFDHDASWQMLALINQRRSEAGLDPLEMDDSLYSCALIRVQEIALKFGSSRMDGTLFFELPTFDGKCMAENIAQGKDTPELALSTFLDLAGTRINILNPEFQSIGIGCLTVNGVTYWVQDFSKESPFSMERFGTETITNTIRINPESLPFVIANTELAIGDSEMVILKAISNLAEIAIEPDGFAFASSDTSVLTVDEQGLITGVGAGTAQVIAKHQANETYQAFAVIEVKDAGTSETTEDPVDPLESREQDDSEIGSVDREEPGSDFGQTTAIAMDTALAITRQPESQYVQNGQTAVVTLEAEGDGLAYQWYIKNRTSISFSKSSVTKPIYSVKMTDAVNGRELYCVVKDMHGHSVASITVSLNQFVPLSIVTQPQDSYAANGQKAMATVEATGEGLSYQWFLKNKTATKFSKSSITKNTYSVTMSDKVDGRQLYCVVTDKNGNTITSETVTLYMQEPLAIVAQPQDGYAANGQKAIVTVEATGEGLSYQWYLKNKTATKFSKSSVVKNTYSVTMTDAVDGRQLYCIVSDKNGNSVTSETVTLHMREPLVIVAQPQDSYTASGQKAKAIVEATGEGLSYQWYVKNRSATKFSKSSITKNTYSVTMTDTVDGRQLYCVVTDSFGNTMETETVTMRKLIPLSIVMQPADVANPVVGMEYTMHVEAEGNDLTYQWKTSTDGGATWNNSSDSGNNTASLTIMITNTSNGYMYYCEVQDVHGNQLDSNIVVVHLNEFNDGVFTYKLNDDESGVIVTGCLVDESSLIVPDSFNGLPVVEIGEGAFLNNGNLVSIDLPDTIVVIRSQAFMNCSNLVDMH